MIKRTMITCSLLLFFSLSVEPAQAECSIDDSGVITLSSTNNSVANCNADALEIGYEFIDIGMCTAFPNISGGDWSACTTLIDRPVNVDISEGSSQSLSGFIPPAATYPFGLAIVSADMKLRGLLSFSHNLIGGTGENAEVSAQPGRYCQPPNFEWTTGTVFENVYPTQCTVTRPDDSDLNPGHFKTTNVGRYSWSAQRSYGAGLSSERGDNQQIDPNAITNLVLLDRNNQVAETPEDVENLVIIYRYPEAIEIDENLGNLNLGFTTKQAFGFSYRCGFPGDPNVCVIFTPYLGAGAFTLSVIE